MATILRLKSCIGDLRDDFISKVFRSQSVSLRSGSVCINKVLLQASGGKRNVLIIPAPTTICHDSHRSAGNIVIKLGNIAI